MVSPSKHRNLKPQFIYLFIHSFIHHKRTHYNLQAIEMKVESLIVINNAYDRHRKNSALISSLFRNCRIAFFLNILSGSREN